MQTNARNIIGKWPSLAIFAKDIGVPYQNAFRMKSRNSVPPTHWSSIIDAAEKRGIEGVTLEILSSAYPKPQSKAQ